MDLADDLFWEDSEDIHMFRFTKLSSTDIEKIYKFSAQKWW